MKKEEFLMNRNSFATEKVNTTKEEYYEGKRLSAFSMVSVAGSFAINALIIVYAIINTIV